jgi:phosphoglycerol geranylgeranyltransferase
MVSWQKFRHITKLDPDKKNTPQILKTVLESNTDAIMISGTQGITKSNVNDLYKELKESTTKPLIVEPVHKSAIIYDIDFIYIPVVLNTSMLDWVQNMHVDWLGDLVKEEKNLPWEKVISEGYIILNPESTVAKVTKANTNLSNEKVASYANYGQLLGMDAIYLEYSGTYGSLETVQFTKKFMNKSKFFYGGGISSKEQSKEMLKYADTIFVGNIIYSDLIAYINTIPEK